MSIVNTLQPLQWLQEAKRLNVGKIVVVGTALEYSGQGNLDNSDDSPEISEIPKLDELSPLESANGYGATKAAGGILLRAFARENYLQLRYLRMATIYGPGDDAQNFFPAAKRLAIARKPFPMTGGVQVRDWLHVSDAVGAISMAIGIGETIPGDVLNIGTSEGVSLKDLAKSIYESYGADTDLIKFGEIPYRKLEKQFLVLDTQKAREVLGWEAVRKTPYPKSKG
jgi:nucleoside-diphosphate-sugar epimerase